MQSTDIPDFCNPKILTLQFNKYSIKSPKPKNSRLCKQVSGQSGRPTHFESTTQVSPLSKLGTKLSICGGVPKPIGTEKPMSSTAIIAACCLFLEVEKTLKFLARRCRLWWNSARLLPEKSMSRN